MSQNNSNAKTAMLAKLTASTRWRALTLPRLPWIIRISIRRETLKASLS